MQTLQNQLVIRAHSGMETKNAIGLVTDITQNVNPVNTVLTLEFTKTLLYRKVEVRRKNAKTLKDI